MVSYFNGRKTGTNGRVIVQAEYPQNVATWLLYKLTVSSNAAGSECAIPSGNAGWLYRLK